MGRLICDLKWNLTITNMIQCICTTTLYIRMPNDIATFGGYKANQGNINHVNAMLLIYIASPIAYTLHKMMNLNRVAPPISCSTLVGISSNGVINKLTNYIYIYYFSSLLSIRSMGWAYEITSRKLFFFLFGFEFKCLRFKSIYNCLF